MLKVLVADNSDDFMSDLFQLMKGSYIVKTANNGIDAVRLLKEFCPDVVILDFMLSEIDGADLLRIGASRGVHPTVLALTRYQNDYLQGTAESLGIDYIMVRPCRAQAVFSRLVNLLKYREHTGLGMPTVEENLEMTLDVLGLNSAHIGYQYIIKAVFLMDREPYTALTKIVYPQIGAEFGGNGKQVERSIRSAIVAAWETRDDRIWKCYFKSDAQGTVPRPSNQAFLKMLLRQLGIWRNNCVK